MTFFNVKAELEKLERVRDDMLNQPKATTKKKISTISLFSTDSTKKCETSEEIAIFNTLNNNNYYLSSSIKENRLKNKQIRQKITEKREVHPNYMAKQANCANSKKEISIGLDKITATSASLGFPEGRVKCIDCEYWKQSLCEDKLIKFPYRAHYCKNHILSN